MCVCTNCRTFRHLGGPSAERKYHMRAKWGGKGNNHMHFASHFLEQTQTATPHSIWWFTFWVVLWVASKQQHQTKVHKFNVITIFSCRGRNPENTHITRLYSSRSPTKIIMCINTLAASRTHELHTHTYVIYALTGVCLCVKSAWQLKHSQTDYTKLSQV